MIYTKLTIRAMKIAYEAHHGQVDKAGIPYVLHPLHLAEQMDDEASTCVALLHDVVEDTDWTLEQLKAEFPQEVTDALALLTHAEGVPFMEYVRPIKQNTIARKVKLADLAHNCDQIRFADTPVDEGRLAYFRNKYAAAREYLLAE